MRIDSANMRRLLRVAAIAFAFVALAYPVAAWLLGWAAIIGSSGAEYHAICETDRPLAYHLLTFGPWHAGPGPCTPSHIHSEICGRPWAQVAVVLEHRVGTTQGVITQFVYYEAKYESADGTVRITHATGPTPLINHRKDTLIAGILCPALIATGLAIASMRLRSGTPVNSAVVPS